MSTKRFLLNYSIHSSDQLAKMTCEDAYNWYNKPAAYCSYVDQRFDLEGKVLNVKDCFEVFLWDKIDFRFSKNCWTTWTWLRKRNNWCRRESVRRITIQLEKFLRWSWFKFDFVAFILLRKDFIATSLTKPIALKTGLNAITRGFCKNLIGSNLFGGWSH